MGFLDNIRKSASGTKGRHGPNKPPATKYFGGIGEDAMRALEAGKGHEKRSRVITYHHPDDVPESGRAQYGQLGLGGSTGPDSWYCMIVGEAFAATPEDEREGVPTPDYLPYDVVKKGAKTIRPIALGMTEDEAYGDEFAEGLKMAVADTTYGEIVKNYLAKHGR